MLINSFPVATGWLPHRNRSRLARPENMLNVESICCSKQKVFAIQNERRFLFNVPIVQFALGFEVKCKESLCKVWIKQNLQRKALLVFKDSFTQEKEKKSIGYFSSTVLQSLLNCAISPTKWSVSVLHCKVSQVLLRAAKSDWGSGSSST